MKKTLFIIAVAMGLLTLSSWGFAQNALPLPNVSVNFSQAQTPAQTSTSLQILLLLTVLTLAPALVIMVTSFTRIIIVLSFVRQALSTQQIPPNQVLVALALFMTFFVMSPVFDQINQQAIQPYMRSELTQAQAFEKGIGPLRTFMIKQTRPNDIALFVHLSKAPKPKRVEDVATTALIPAFIISELKTAFQMGFIIFIPFLIVDLVVASTLMSMGMLLLPPILISFPFKLLLFIMVDGWHLICRSLVYSFH